MGPQNPTTIRSRLYVIPAGDSSVQLGAQPIPDAPGTKLFQPKNGGSIKTTPQNQDAAIRLRIVFLETLTAGFI